MLKTLDPVRLALLVEPDLTEEDLVSAAGAGDSAGASSSFFLVTFFFLSFLSSAYDLIKTKKNRALVFKGQGPFSSCLLRMSTYKITAYVLLFLRALGSL